MGARTPAVRATRARRSPWRRSAPRRVVPRIATVVATLLALLAALLGPLAPAHAADTEVVVDFETGPAVGSPVNDEYAASAFVRFLESDPGFRPYRRSAPGAAHSGTVVADVGSDVCFPETHDAGGCEFVTPSSTMRLTRTATTVSVYAGLFAASSGTVSARLTAYRADGTTAATGTAIPLSASGFANQVSVTSGAADIARVSLTVEGPGAVGARLGFDDLTLTYPEGTLPDFSLGAPTSVLTVLQGGELAVPVDVTRVNGSSGPVALSTTGLPAGVFATFAQNPVPATAAGTTMTLSAATNATTFVEPVTVTVTGDPGGDAATGTGTRSATFLLVVRSGLELATAGTVTQVRVPRCGYVDVPLRIQRSLQTTQTVSLAAYGQDLVAEFLPDATVAPGGNLIAERTLRLRRASPTAFLPGVVTISATAPGLSLRTLQLPLADAADSATLTTTYALGPRRGLPGGEVRMEGTGFCAGTQVQVGNDRAVVAANVGADERSLTFTLPRLATTGKVTVVPPAGPTYETANDLTVATFRNRDGFAFENYSYGWLSFGELADYVGIDEMFIEVNPCWPWASCPIPTGIPDPVAYLAWGVINLALHLSGGHCFGISRTVQELLAKKVSYLQFASGVDHNFALPGPNGPNAALGRWLDMRHAGQATAEFLAAYFTRDRSVSGQLNRIRSELVAGRYPGVSMQEGWSGHVVTAYDVESRPDGSTWVYVYDSNRPFLLSENGNGPDHENSEVVGSVIRIDAAKQHWEFDLDSDTRWSGGGSDIYAVPLSAIPDDPSLPGLNGLRSFTFFGSPGGAAQVTSVPDGAEFVPVQDPAATPGSAGFVVAPAEARDSAVTVTGSGSGTYTHVVVGGGFAAGVSDVPTAAGVDDRVAVDTRAGTVTFSGERARPLAVEVARHDGAAAVSAVVRTRVSSGGEDRVGLTSGGAIAYRHDGAATSVSLTLTRTDGHGVARFESGPVSVPAGATLGVAPVSKDLDRVRVQVTRPGAAPVTRVLSNRAGSTARLSLGKPKLTTAGKKTRLSVRVKAVGVSSGAAGVVVRVQRNGKTVARRTVALASLTGAKTLTWRLPRLAASSYRVLANATLVVGGDRPATVRRSSSASVRLR